MLARNGELMQAERRTQEAGWSWATLLLSSVSLAALVFTIWEVVENRFFRNLDYLTLHYLYITRGMTTSLLLAVWAAWYVMRQRRRAEAELRRSWQHYRRLLEVSPAAVALYDADLRVIEWNVMAERLYGFSRAEVVGQRLPTIPADKEQELQGFLQRVSAGESILDVETRRRHARGDCFDVQLSLRAFHEDPNQDAFLEVTSDNRERVRLRQTLVEVESLRSTSELAAGTAHHLNSPLAAMLLRVQMMRDRGATEPLSSELEQLENGLAFCRHFVRRLQELTRRPAGDKQPEDLARALTSVVGFLNPPLAAKRARVELDLQSADGGRVLADRNLLEALFLILLGNALDAIPEGGAIAVRCGPPAAGRIEVRIADQGCGIPAPDLGRVFEPFFTTKGTAQGTGLGLAIARRIVVEHGGSIRLESAVGVGTTAVVELPTCGEEAA